MKNKETATSDSVVFLFALDAGIIGYINRHNFEKALY